MFFVAPKGPYSGIKLFISYSTENDKEARDMKKIKFRYQMDPLEQLRINTDFQEVTFWDEESLSDAVVIEYSKQAKPRYQTHLQPHGDISPDNWDN